MGQQPALPMGPQGRADRSGPAPLSAGQPTTPVCGTHARGGAPTEGSPTVTVEEGFRGGHQRSEGTVPGKVRAAGAHLRWPARVRSRAGPSRWRSPAVRGSGEPSMASGGVRDGGEKGVLVARSEQKRDRGAGGRKTSGDGGAFKGARWGGSGGGGGSVARVPRGTGRVWGLVPTDLGPAAARAGGWHCLNGACHPVMRGPWLAMGGRGEERRGGRGPAQEKNRSGLSPDEQESF
jgi:hypothetical protein